MSAESPESFYPSSEQFGVVEDDEEDSHDDESATDIEEEDVTELAASNLNLEDSSQPEPKETGTKSKLFRAMRDALVIGILSFMATQIMQETGQSGGGQFVMGVADDVPEAAAPRRLKTRAYARRGQSFLRSPFVDDFPRGDVYQAFAEADKHEDVFVMYYAPWDADSQAAKAVFARVAETYHLAGGLGSERPVYFASVNCWLPRSDCVKQFHSGDEGKDGDKKKKRQPIHQFPILVYYPKHRRGVQYNGPLTPNHLARFVESVSRPVAHLASLGDWLDLRVKHGGNGLVGYFPGLYGDPYQFKQYKRFLEVAYYRLENYDPLWPAVGMGVVTCPKLAFKLQLNQSSIPVRLSTWNGTTVAWPNKTITSAQSLFEWVQAKAVSPPVTWIDVAGRKSVGLGQSLLKGTANSLLAFLPNPTSRALNNQPYETILEMAIRYNTCDGEEPPASQQALLSSLRLSHTTSHARCVAVQSQCMAQPWYADHVRDACADNNATLQLNFKPLKGYVMTSKEVETFGKDSKVVQGQVTTGRLACLSSMGCQSSPYLQAPDPSISGLGCRDNKTLNFYTLSSDVSAHLAESIGLPRPLPLTTFAIVSAKEETVFTCDGSDSLSHCVRTYHENPSSLARVKVTAVGTKADSSGSTIEEITGKNFLQTVMDKELNVVLLYHTRSCAFCTAASSAAASFHAVNRIVSASASASARIKFVTVDAAHNDLPWEFTALSVPTVLFFPAEKGTNRSKSDTRVFPSAKPLTTSNLLNFVLANLSPQERSHLKSVYLNRSDKLKSKDIPSKLEAREEL